jgi:carboxypeptidase Q
MLGSRAYVGAHADELDRLCAVLIMDSGAQVPRGLMTEGRTDVAASMRRLLAPLTALGASETSLEADFEQDHAPFLAAGVPALTLWVAEGEYDVHHHAISDSFDKVDPRMLGLDTAVLAVAAYRLAEAAEPPGRRLSASETTELLGRLGLESVRRLVYETGESR